MASFVIRFSVAFTLYILGILIVRTESQHLEESVPDVCTYIGLHIDCSRKKLREIPRRFPVQVIKIDLSYNELTDVDVSIFSNLTHLRIIKLGHNQLKTIPRFAAHNITDLMLDHNLITSLDASRLRNLPNLRTLDVSSNKISTITTFPTNSLLKQLHVNHNRVSVIGPGTLNKLSQLEVFRMNRNQLQIINKHTFEDLTNLQTLELMRNNIHTVEALSFKSLVKLRVLKLRKNHISQLADGAFWGLKSIQVLKLDHNNISTVGEGWLYGLASLEGLSLSNNAITEVKPVGWKFCQLLRQLDLRHNLLSSIKTENFHMLDKLEYLHLDHNNLKDVDTSAFLGLNNLESLQMNHNEVTWSVDDMNGAFNGLTSLTRLGLASNRITTIAANAFSELTVLRSLDLSDNAIASIQRNAFAGMTSLTEIRVNTSALLCDCTLSWLSQWLRENSRYRGQVTGVCAHPHWLKTRNILDVKSDEFKCDDVPKPIIISSPKSHVALRGSNTQLDCTVASSSNSPMQFQWRKDGQLMTDPDVEKLTLTDASTVINSTTILHVNSVTDSDEGVYQCIATNEFGSTYSYKARVTVHVLPTFSKIPANVTVKAGNTARLECSATGHPAPQIVWQKDGGDDFPAAHERRMHVMPTDVVFFIVKVKAADSGVYSCIATSAAGRIIANATVSVLENPSFVKGMADKKVRARETAVLECLATGSPKPKLTWLKDDHPLEVSPRHFFTADNQLLIIVQTEQSDAGKYTCQMTNTLGTESDHCELSILPAAGSMGARFMSSINDQSTMIGIIVIAVVCCVVGTSLVWVVIIYQTRKKAEDYTPTPTDEVTLPLDLPSSSADLYPSKHSSRLSLHHPEMLSARHALYRLSAVSLGNLPSQLSCNHDDSRQPILLRSSWLDHPSSSSPPVYYHNGGTAAAAAAANSNNMALGIERPTSSTSHQHQPTVAIVHSNYTDTMATSDRNGQHSCCHGNATLGGCHGTQPPNDQGGDSFCERCAMLNDEQSPNPSRQSTLLRHKQNGVTNPPRDDVITLTDAMMLCEDNGTSNTDVILAVNNNVLDVKCRAQDDGHHGNSVICGNLTFTSPPMASHRTIV